MEAAVPCKEKTKSLTCLQEAVAWLDASNKFAKTQYACSVEFHESTRPRKEQSLLKDHEDHIASKGNNSVNHYNLVHKSIPMYGACRGNSRCKCSSGKRMEEARHDPMVRQKQSPRCYVRGVRTKNSEGRVALRGDIVKDDSGAHAVFTEQGSSASQMTTAKVMDVIARVPVMDKQLTQYQHTLRGQGRSHTSQTSEVSMS